MLPVGICPTTYSSTVHNHRLYFPEKEKDSTIFYVSSQVFSDHRSDTSRQSHCDISGRILRRRVGVCNCHLRDRPAKLLKVVIPRINILPLILFIFNFKSILPCFLKSFDFPVFCFSQFYQIGNRRSYLIGFFITEQGIPYTGLTGETFTSFVPAVYIGEYVACQLASNQVRDKKGYKTYPCSRILQK